MSSMAEPSLPCAEEPPTNEVHDLALRQRTPGSSVSCIKGTAAFFIHPHGEILSVRENHISSVIQSPERFGFDLHEIEARYKIHGEPLYKEGAARTEILLDLMRNGWIRLRRYPNRYWSATVKTLSPHTMRRMCVWAEEMVAGIGTVREEDLFMPVRIAPVTGEKVKRVTLESLLDRKSEVAPQTSTTGKV